MTIEEARAWLEAPWRAEKLSFHQAGWLYAARCALDARPIARLVYVHSFELERVRRLRLAAEARRLWKHSEVYVDTRRRDARVLAFCAAVLRATLPEEDGEEGGAS